MRVSREQAAQHHDHIVATASRLFRERGFDGVGVADLMRAAGLTHGGFYGHFAAKDALIAEATAHALEQSRAFWARLAARDDALAAMTAAYLSPRHRDLPGRGCLVAAAGPEIARMAAPVRAAATRGVRAMVDLLARALSRRTAAARRDAALATYATLVGAMVLARAVDDPQLSDDILRAAGSHLQGTLSRGSPRRASNEKELP